MGATDIEIPKYERVVQMVLQEVVGSTQLYDGRYQDSKGVVGAREA
jgi:deoxycytidine triphosphate deaminase